MYASAITDAINVVVVWVPYAKSETDYLTAGSCQSCIPLKWRPSITQCWLVPALYFDDAPSAQLTHHFLMDEEILPVCSPDYASRYSLTGSLVNLPHCTLLHDRQAWSNDSGTDEWHSWAQHFAVNLPTSSGIGFDRSDLAVIAAMNHIGVAMGRKRLVQKRLDSGELVAPFGDMTLKCHQHYYITTLPGRQWPKIEAFIGWLQEQVK